MKNILQYSTHKNILLKKSADLTIEEIKSKEIQSLISEMKETMRNAPGVGLAAPQIGISKKIAVIEDRAELTKDITPTILKERGRVPIDFHVIINPKIIKVTGEINYFFEGCLSISGCARITPRLNNVTIECLDENANLQIIEAEGWYARILQHEIGHLNGQLYIDIADKKSEIKLDEEYKTKWLNASRADILGYYNEKCGF